MNRYCIAAVSTIAALSVMSAPPLTARASSPKPRPNEIAVTLTGGHDTEEVDHGRPVVLIAAALGVPADVFRDAFSHVRPARGRGPTGDEARKNKDELLGRLAKYGVTNERLDEVSNYYRYRRENGEMWPIKPAAVFAVVKDGRVVGYRVADPGAGYSSLPTLAVDGRPDLKLTATVHFDKDLAKNGAIESIRPAAATTAP